MLIFSAVRLLRTSARRCFVIPWKYTIYVLSTFFLRAPDISASFTFLIISPTAMVTRAFYVRVSTVTVSFSPELGSLTNTPSLDRQGQSRNSFSKAAIREVFVQSSALFLEQ